MPKSKKQPTKANFGLAALSNSASRTALGLMALEPRVLLDAAGVVTGAEGAADAIGQTHADIAASNLFSALDAGAGFENSIKSDTGPLLNENDIYNLTLLQNLSEDARIANISQSDVGALLGSLSVVSDQNAQDNADPVEDKTPISQGLNTIKFTNFDQFSAIIIAPETLALTPDAKLPAYEGLHTIKHTSDNQFAQDSGAVRALSLDSGIKSPLPEGLHTIKNAEYVLGDTNIINLENYLSTRVSEFSPIVDSISEGSLPRNVNIDLPNIDFAELLEDFQNDALLEQNAPASIIVFVDTTVANYQDILDTLDPNTEVVLIGARQDGIEVMANYLEGRTDIDAIHIISHGRDGTFNLGTSRVNSGSINGRYADELTIIGQALTASGDILIYGCDFGQDIAAALALAQATGADIAASNDDTGSAELGGNWDLEIKLGDIEAVNLEAPEWNGLLAPLTITITANPVTGGGNGLGAWAVWENAGSVGGTAIDIRATVISADPGATITFTSAIGEYAPGQPADDMWLQVAGGDVVVRWEIFAAGTNQTVTAVGSPDFRISDIDGDSGAALGFPNVEVEAVAPSLNGLTSYTIETASNLDVGIDAGRLLVRGTENQNAESTSLVAFSWTDVSSWDVTYSATPGWGTRFFFHDGDGDFTFSSPSTTFMLSIDADGDDSTTGGANYLGSFTENSGGTAIVDSDVDIVQDAALGVNLHQATITLTNPQVGDEYLINGVAVSAGDIGVVGGLNYTITNVGGELIVSLTGAATDAVYEAALQLITFNNTTEDPDVTDRAFTISVTNDTFGTTSNVAISTITITALNDVPIAVDDTDSIDEDSVLSVNAANGVITPNDTDPDSADTLVVSAVNGAAGDVDNQITLASGALLTLNADGSYDYDPNGAFESLAIGASATDSFNYTVSDGNGGSDTATVIITINGVNDAPIANDDVELTGENIVHSDSVLVDNGNGVDSDPDGDTLTITQVNGAVLTSGAVITLPSGALLTMNADGSYDYDPNGAFESLGVGQNTMDSFTYTVSDGNGGTDTATVTFTITGSNDAPVAENNTAVATEDSVPATGNVVTDIDAIDGVDTDIDGDTLVVSIVDGTAIPGPGTTDVVGSLGTLTIAPDGSYSYAVDNTNPAVQALGVGQSTTEIFTYTVDDGNGGTDTATLTITINGTNDAPDAIDDIGTTNEDTILAVGSVAGLVDNNDLDIDGDTLILTEVNGVAGNVSASIAGTNGGTFIINADGSYSFDPGSDFQDLDNGETRTSSISYTIDDGEGGTDTAALTVTVQGANDAPVAVDDADSTDEDTAISIGAASGLIDPNDTDAESDTLTVSEVNGLGASVGNEIVLASGALLTVNADGSYDYAPNGQFENLAVGDTATDTFTYTVTDGNGNTDTATVTITINGVNDAPVAVNDANSTDEDTIVNAVVASGLININDTDTDGDTLQISAVAGTAWVSGVPITLPSGAILTLNADGSYAYNPNGQFDDLAVGENTTDTFTYTVSDGNGGTDTAIVTLTINGVNDAPDAVDDTGTTDQDTAISAGVASGLIDVNDMDPDGSDVLTVSAVDGNSADVNNQITLPSGALLTVNADGSYDYDPNGAFDSLAIGDSTTDSFTYTVSDGNGGTDTATVTLTINGANDAPVANPDTNSTNEDTALNVDVASGIIQTNDSDLDGDTLQISAVSGAVWVSGVPLTLSSGALLTLNADGSYSYDPNGQFENLAIGETGTDTFTYTVSDGNGGTDTATVTITINGVNDAPVPLDPANPGVDPADTNDYITAQSGE